MKKIRLWAIWNGEDFARQEYDEGLPHLYIDKSDALDSIVIGERLILVEIVPVQKKAKKK